MTCYYQGPCCPQCFGQLPAGLQDQWLQSWKMDRSGGEVHQQLRRLVLRHRDVGGDELRGETLLELVQPGRYQGY